MHAAVACLGFVVVVCTTVTLFCSVAKHQCNSDICLTADGCSRGTQRWRPCATCCLTTKHGRRWQGKAGRWGSTQQRCMRSSWGVAAVSKPLAPLLMLTYFDADTAGQAAAAS